MSSGLGALQRRVLKALEQEGKPAWLVDLAWRVYNDDKGEDDDWDRATEAFESSVRRAVRGLKVRGLLNAEPGGAKWHRDEGRGCRLL